MKRADIDKTMPAYQTSQRNDNSISNSVMCDTAHHFTADCPDEETETETLQV